MKHIASEFAAELGEGKVKEGEMLSRFSTMRIGGPADFFFRAYSIEELVQCIKFVQKKQIPYFILGGGTNVLFPDRGFGGIVIRNDTQGIRLAGIRGGKIGQLQQGTKRKVFLEVDSGVLMNRLVRFCLEQGLSGLEYFLGQPGTVGGAVYMNAHNMRTHTYFGDFVIGAKVLTKHGETLQVDHDYFKFGYDTSSIQKSKDIVLRVTVELSGGEKEASWKLAQENLTHRMNTQPTGVYSLGCTFRNISKSEAIRLATPEFTCSAGYLLERVGLKGVKSGDACFSPVHANFIVHKGAARSSDVLELIYLAKEKVKKKFGITLLEEIIIAT